MSSLSDVVLTMLSLTAVSPSASCTAWQFTGIAICIAGLVFDTVLSFDGLLIFLVSCIAVALFVCPLLTVILGSTLLTAALTFYRMYEAYSAFVALGPGLALPSSSAGFWRATQIARLRTNVNSTGFLQQQISERQGPTPYTVGTSLHKQINQQTPEDVQQYFTDLLALFAATHFKSGSVTSSPSGTTSSVLASPCNCFSSLSLRTFGCNVCQPQRSNCGVHVTLHPSDFEEVLRTGHGEMHPLASTNSRFSHSRGNSCLPSTLALVYAPREYSEVCTVMRIIEAGAKYVASIDGEAI